MQTRKSAVLPAGWAREAGARSVVYRRQSAKRLREAMNGCAGLELLRYRWDGTANFVVILLDDPRNSVPAPCRPDGNRGSEKRAEARIPPQRFFIGPLRWK